MLGLINNVRGRFSTRNESCLSVVVLLQMPLLPQQIGSVIPDGVMTHHLGTTALVKRLSQLRATTGLKLIYIEGHCNYVFKLGTAA